MTVQELIDALQSIHNKDLKVVYSHYCASEINGFYIDTQEENKYVFLTRLNVIPRVGDGEV